MNIRSATFLLILCCPCLVQAAEQSPWILAVIGDQQFAVAQHEKKDLFNRFTSQTQWLADHGASFNLRFIAQVGDIVEHSIAIAEWDRALAAMQTLDKAKNADGGIGIPWSVAYGNHEIIGAKLNPTVDLAGPSPSATYRQYFGSASGKHRFANQPAFRGESTNGLNTWHIIKSSNADNARQYLLLNLEIDIPGKKQGTNFDAIKWAQSILDSSPGVATIITTHVFEGSKFGPPKRPYLTGFGHNSQLEIFDKLIKTNPQVFLILSGHTSEETHQIKQNAEQQPVLQLATDYNKWLGEAGDGYFRLIELDESAGRLRVRTYSALLDNYRTDANGQFEIPIDFKTRFAAAVTSK